MPHAVSGTLYSIPGTRYQEALSPMDTPSRCASVVNSWTIFGPMQCLSHRVLGLGLIALFFAACQPETAPSTKPEATLPALPPVPLFNGDSAYAYVAKQVSFGPRVPGTAEHRA